jgi:hypothetical protein
VALKSALHLRSLADAHRPPVAPHVVHFDIGAWSTLQVMLVEERRLIEFLTGPRTQVRKGQCFVRDKDDICLNCFSSTPENAWAMHPDPTNPADPYSVLRWRAERINKRVAHFSWVLLDDSDSRTVSGIWQTGYLREIATQLGAFTDWLEHPTRCPAASRILRRALSVSRTGIQQLQTPGPPFGGC